MGGGQERTARRTIDRVALAWALVSLVGLIAMIYRIAAFGSDSIQAGADAMIWALLAFVVSALFCRWLSPRLPRTVAVGLDDTAHLRRWVVAA
ncbi:MAG: hypothetical protein QM809_03850 [Gordonia sp. (in: high G+C Gram-positive bacteria)]|uniref:hypothetical protein n=1 Tax=Gordonia sp. (in: high G+C Gram-positive bacteria) TaxID=84139 RepID=UPI0039E6A877